MNEEDGRKESIISQGILQLHKENFLAKWELKRKQQLERTKHIVKGECKHTFDTIFSLLRDFCLLIEERPYFSTIIDKGMDTGRKFVLPSMGTAQSAGVVYGKTVQTSTGSIRGRVYEIDDERKVDAFLGIPYAEPPVGALRFQRPVPREPWTETLDCVHFGPRCPQTDEYFTGYLNIVGKDEAQCLTLNVFAPSWTHEDYPHGFPIMVWIHGGGFVMHSSSNYGDRSLARNLCSKDVVVVSVNYRLGIFGFLCTADDICKGNMGLWDQTLALQWVKENAGVFGGDPDNITLFGQSAGGASVDLLSLSPHSRDLFHKVIPMAGCGECDFAVRSAKEQRKFTSEYAKFLGWKPKDENNSEEMLAFYQKQYAEVLEIGISGKKGFGHPGQLYFTPNLDGDFFPKSITELRRESPKKPILTGTTLNEGLFFMGLSTFSRSYDGMKKFLSKVILETEFDDVDSVRKELLEFYTKGCDPKDKQEITQRFVKLLGDFAINVGISELARKSSELGSDVYLYSFNYYNPHGFGIVKWLLPYLGATHCTELRYILGKGVISKFKPNEEDLEMLELMTTYFTNFAKYGNPNGEEISGSWEKYTSSNPYRHFAISLEPRMADNYLERRPDFWRKLRQANKARCNL